MFRFMKKKPANKQMAKSQMSKKLLKSQAGLSLVEILIALTLLAVAGTFVLTNVIDSLREGEIKSTQIQIGRLGDILIDYKRKCGMFPTTEQGLDALLSAPTTGKECRRYPPNGFIDGNNIPQDPWGYEFLYESDGRDYKIISYGPDGMEGGEGVDADISSEDL
ncbi:MAG: type II secretion system major pseudopilin GspG [Bacteriovoracaceae bacterium]